MTTLRIDNCAPLGPAHTITLIKDGRSYAFPVTACTPSDGGLIETFELGPEITEPRTHSSPVVGLPDSMTLAPEPGSVQEAATVYEMRAVKPGETLIVRVPSDGWTTSNVADLEDWFAHRLKAMEVDLKIVFVFGDELAVREGS